MYIFITAVVNIALDILSIIWILGIIVQYLYIINPNLAIEIKPYKNQDALLVLLAIFRLTDVSRHTFYHIFNEFISTGSTFELFTIFSTGIAIQLAIVMVILIIIMLLKRAYFDKQSGLNMFYTSIFILLIIFANRNEQIMTLIRELFT